MKVDREMVERVWIGQRTKDVTPPSGRDERVYLIEESDRVALCSLAEAVMDGREALERVADYLVEVANDNGELPDAVIRADAAALRRILDHLEDEP